jgi:pimeloyl-ACP methyl ester carboxylesterase
MMVNAKGACVHISRWLTLSLILAASGGSAWPQALSADFVHGVDYSFQRMEATRTVRDAEDRGKIRLVILIYRPLKLDRHQVALFSHGSTGGEIKSPKEPWEGPPPAVIRFFISRGYTVVAPMRRGRGESSGTYVEECAFYAGECTLAEQTAMTGRSLREAMLDTRAVIDQVILGKLNAGKRKIVLVGTSRGGLLSLMTGAVRPQQVAGVVNFAGGWLSVSDKYSAADNQQRLDVQRKLFVEAGREKRVPSLWIYAARDQLYGEATTREFFRAYQETGGRGDYLFVSEHALPNGHNVSTVSSLWETAVDAFLTKLDGANAP